MSVLCKLANASRAGYYKWLLIADKIDKDYEDYLKVKKVFDGGKGKYGWRSIKMRIKAMNHKKIQRIMRKYDLNAKVRRRNPYKAIMKKRLEHRIFPNKLQREFNQIIPYKVFCTDITYIPFQNQFAYLSVVKDIDTPYKPKPVDNFFMRHARTPPSTICVNMLCMYFLSIIILVLGVHIY